MTWIQIAILISGWLLISIGAGLACLPAGFMVAGALAIGAVYLSVLGGEGPE